MVSSALTQNCREHAISAEYLFSLGFDQHTDGPGREASAKLLIYLKLCLALQNFNTEQFNQGMPCASRNSPRFLMITGGQKLPVTLTSKSKELTF